MQGFLRKKQKRWPFDHLFVEKSVRISNGFFEDLAKIGAFIDSHPKLLESISAPQYKEPQPKN